MNRRILRLAIPNIISNITIPLLGLASTVIAGSIGSDLAIAGVGLGSMVFSFIYWNCSFIRMGASGMTAQALGARNLWECANILIRSLAIALAIAVLLLVFQRPIWRGAQLLLRGDQDTVAMAAEYFFARVWAAPATISHYAIQGWFIGMQNSRTPMIISIIINLLAIVFGYVFVFTFGYSAPAGIAYGIVVAQYAGLVISAALWWKFYRRFVRYVNWREVFRAKALGRFFNVNKDIFIRSFCNTCVYSFFPFISLQFGATMVATNTILIHLFTFFSYMLDGFGYAAEALTGRFTGARNFAALRESIIKMFWWCGAIAAAFVLVYWLFWPQIIGLFNPSEGVLAAARQVKGWIMIVPLVGFAPFLMDGIFIGVTKTRILRNSMLVSAAVFFALYYGLVGSIGVYALWPAFVAYLVSRGVCQVAMSNRLEGLIWHKAEAK
ncbi:MATE family efflux transporter [Alistipes sp. OttesenSCG-928-B03]|nr:MATE family efflux transporter [Alistipes sp. OttesenSCG-928-B03]